MLLNTSYIIDKLTAIWKLHSDVDDDDLEANFTALLHNAFFKESYCCLLAVRYAAVDAKHLLNECYENMDTEWVVIDNQKGFFAITLLTSVDLERNQWVITFNNRTLTLYVTINVQIFV